MTTRRRSLTRGWSMTVCRIRTWTAMKLSWLITKTRGSIRLEMTASMQEQVLSKEDWGQSHVIREDGYTSLWLKVSNLNGTSDSSKKTHCGGQLTLSRGTRQESSQTRKSKRKWEFLTTLQVGMNRTWSISVLMWASKMVLHQQCWLTWIMGRRKTLLLELKPLTTVSHPKPAGASISASKSFLEGLKTIWPNLRSYLRKADHQPLKLIRVVDWVVKVIPQ